MRIGELQLTALSDGLYRLPQEFYVGLDFDAHPELVAADGRVHIPVGCFLVTGAGQTVLVDAGVGDVDPGDWGHGGDLPMGLERAGVAPADIDVVVATHLHIDHIGWLVHADRPFFPNATVRFGPGDWEPFVAAPDTGDRGRRIMEVLAAHGCLEPLEGDTSRVAPGVSARHLPGHTPGHYGLVLASRDERALLLGDAVECPLQLTEPDFHALSDIDPGLAARTRERLWRELEGTDALVTGSHFPELAFGRVLRGSGRRYFAASRPPAASA